MIDVLEVGNATDDKLTVTLSGKAEEVIRVLTKGLPVEDLMKLQEAMQDEIDRRVTHSRSTR